MAKQSGNILITGTIDNLCFYKMDGQHYVRLKSSLTRKRVLKDPAFAKTMFYAQQFGQAAKLAAVVYRALPADQKKNGLYKTLTGIANGLLKEGKPAAAIVSRLQDYLKPENVQLNPAENAVINSGSNHKIKFNSSFPARRREGSFYRVAYVAGRVTGAFSPNPGFTGDG